VRGAQRRSQPFGQKNAHAISVLSLVCPCCLQTVRVSRCSIEPESVSLRATASDVRVPGLAR
jgi:predicted transporter